MADPRPRVLVVEDSRVNVGILIGLLQDYDVMVALDGATALELLARKIPDVILLDIVMPGMDGIEVCRRIKAQEALRAIPILFITGLTDEASIIQAFDAGGSDYVTKPFRSRELLARVRIQVEYRRAIAQLRTIALIDGLTELPNRRAFFTDGPRLLNEARARGLPLAAMMLDIDYFKQVNDRHGNAWGDEVLRRVAAGLREQAGTRDLCARIGGEEFALLVNLQDEAHAVAYAERLRERLKGIVVKTARDPVSITVSIGVAACINGDDNLDTLLSRAADRLYTAKRTGRDRVCAAD